MAVGVVVAIVVVGGYLVGSIPVALLVGRAHGVDLRDVGDRNPGWWNAKEQLGRRAAVPVLLGDTAKGALGAAFGVALAHAADGGWGHGYIGGGSAMLGHAWPVFARFRGGRSVLCFVGAAAVVAPIPALVCLAVLAIVTIAARSFAWGARLAVFGFPLVQIVVEGPYRTAATGGLMCIIGVRFALASRAVGG